jgi:hypothetical protein
MEKEFVSYEQALALKELGFDEPCFGYYEPNGELDYIENHILKDFPYLAKNSEWQDLVAAPTFSQAFRWFREKHDKYGVVNIDLSNNLKDKIFVYMVEDKLGYGNNLWVVYNRIIDRSEEYNTYEEAELACLDKLIELVKTK